MVQQVAEPTTSTPPPRRMSYEAWLNWDPGYDVRSEWVDGEVIEFMPTTLRHGLTAGFLYQLVSAYVDFRRLGVVLIDSIEMRMGLARRVPDILFVSNAKRHLLTNQRLSGPADLVIEIVSDDSVERDGKHKFAEYAAAGVPEYWQVDSREGYEDARFYHLIAGEYHQVFPDPASRYHFSTADGFWFRPAWLWQEPLPNALRCLAEIAPDALRAAISPDHHQG